MTNQLGRRLLDFYETPLWQTRALRSRIAIAGTVLECCAGDLSLARPFNEDCVVLTNDIDQARSTRWHLDATKRESWEQFPEVDWVVTNPPFNCAFPILEHAWCHAKRGVVMLLRLSFLEPTKERGDWLSLRPPARQIVLPRWSYKSNGSTDSVTTAWFVWSRSVPHVAPGIEIVPLREKGTR